MHRNGEVKKAIQFLQDRGDIYEKDGALWFASTNYGDDKDRVVIRDNDEPTYLAADIAYHRNKFERGYKRMIDVWGADHHRRPHHVPRRRHTNQQQRLQPDRTHQQWQLRYFLWRGCLR